MKQRGKIIGILYQHPVTQKKYRWPVDKRTYPSYHICLSLSLLTDFVGLGTGFCNSIKYDVTNVIERQNFEFCHLLR